jgi:hypothetical protein
MVYQPTRTVHLGQYAVHVPIIVSFIVLKNLLGIYEEFANAFVKAVQNLQVGNGLLEGTSQVLLSPCLSL